MARRPKRSPERETAILNALRIGNTRRAAAAGAEIHIDTFYEWLRDPTFSEAVIKAEADAEQRFLGVVARAAASGQNWQAAAWWLERRKHEDYARRDKSEMTIDVKREAARIAEEMGMDVDEVLAEAQRIFADSR